MQEKQMPKAGSSAMQGGRSRTHISSWMKNLMKQHWFRVSPVFFIGTVIAAAGTTIYKNDTVIFVGLLIMGLGVVAMWMAETGKPRLATIPGPLVFIAGTVITAMSMTISPSNPLLCGGLFLTGIGTAAMWLIYVGKWGINTHLIAILFTTGVIIEAVSLTVVPSDLLIMVGMIATGIGAFGMWAFELVLETDEEGSTSEKTPVNE